MNRAAAAGAALLLALSTLPTVRAAAADVSRSYDLRWTVRVDSFPAGAREGRIWIAIPQELPEQSAQGLTVKTAEKWRFVTDPTFHNKVVEVTVPHPRGALVVGLAARVLRRPVESPRPATLTTAERALYLLREALVSLSPRIKTLADSIGGTSRTRYDYVLASMDYDKTVPGWGNGDSERACDVHKGNCTDFHSLFMSLSRAEGVPTMFEMGYETNPAGETDHVGGYHCWAWFYDDARKAWIPVDISEADLHPEETEHNFGHLDANRITFSRGRDVALPDMKGSPLNYLPAGAYAEVDGSPLTQGVARAITYTVATEGATADPGARR